MVTLSVNRNSFNRNSFISSFPVSMPSISFSCLIVLAETFTVIEIGGMRIDSLFLFLMLGENIQCFNMKYDAS